MLSPTRRSPPPRAVAARRAPRARLAPLLLPPALLLLLLLGLALFARSPYSLAPFARPAAAVPRVFNPERGQSPCDAPEEPTAGMIDPCPPADWAAELEVRRAGGYHGTATGPGR